MNKFYKSLVSALVLFTSVTTVNAQSDSSSISYSGYADVYYSYDFGNPTNHSRPGFLYNHTRSNELNVNLLLGRINYASDKYRANAGIMYGTYAEYNLSAEQGLLKNVFEANIGVKLCKKQNLWLDAGIMPSHIGFESAIRMDCWTLTRSMAAENSPYFESGVKVTYINKAENLTISVLGLNGWQRIRRPDDVNRPSAGLYVNYKLSDKLSFTYANFVGSDKADSLNALRVFHDSYLIYDGDKFGFIAGFDFGQEQRADGKFNNWYTPQLVMRYKMGEKCKIVARGEYYNDHDQVIIATGTENGFDNIGASLGFDYHISPKCLWCSELKYYNSRDKIYYDNKNIGYENYCATTSLCFRF